MSVETLRLTFAGLCVARIEGKDKDTTSAGLQIFLVKTTANGGAQKPQHFPRLSFRAVDLQECFRDGDPLLPYKTPVDIDVDPWGVETVTLPLPDSVSVRLGWMFGALEGRYDLTWWDHSADPTAASTECDWAPNLRDLGAAQIYKDGTNSAAWIRELPFGGLSTRGIVNSRGVPVRWGLADKETVIANQLALTSHAKKGARLEFQITSDNVRWTYRFLSSDGGVLHLAITNLPGKGPLVEEPVRVGDEPLHLSWYKEIASKKSGSFVLPRKNGLGDTRQGSICPAVRFHTDL